MFITGFVLFTLFFVSASLLLTNNENEKKSLLGIKIAAVGFGIGAIPIAIGAFILHTSDEILNVFFRTGMVLVIVGILIHWVTMFRGNKNS